MVELELQELIERIQARQCEETTIEVKAAHLGCPVRLYDTVSAFSNQNSGGVFVFGLDEKQDYKKVGVYDAQDIQRKVMEYCEQMTPVVRPTFTVCSEGDMAFVSAEIPPVDISERPCFKTAKGRMQGSYTRVGDADKPMTEYEVYSYEAFRKKYRDDIRAVEGMSLSQLNQDGLSAYILARKRGRPNLASLSEEQLYELLSIVRDGRVTLAATLLFCVYPQAFFPQLGIIATCVPGTEMGQLGEDGQRFIDSKRIEGTLFEMLEGALSFVRNNMRVATRINEKTGRRTDIPQYPMDAVREALLNALIHRDYSIHTEGMPIQLIMYEDRLEISNPGGLYGRLTVDQLGNMQPDTRNPVLATAAEAMGQTENRYSGIPRIRRAMREMSLPQPIFIDHRGTFTVVLRNTRLPLETGDKAADTSAAEQRPEDKKGLLEFCRTPRSRQEIVEHIGVSSAQYALRKYLDPLIESGDILLSIPGRPGSPKQVYTTKPER